MTRALPALAALGLCLQACEGCSGVRLEGDAASDAVLSHAWARTFGDTGEDKAAAVLQAPGGGYVVAGWTAFRVLGVDAWMLGLDSSGNVLWARAGGGERDDWALDLVQAADGGFTAAGWTTSSGMGILDTWVLGLDPGGDIQWQKAYGGPGRNAVFSAHRAPDGGIVLGGETQDAEGLVFRPWIMKLHSGGAVAWQGTYGTFDTQSGMDVNRTEDGGTIAARWSHADPVAGVGFILFRLDSDGQLLWSRSYGASGLPTTVRSVSPAAGGGFAAAGSGGFSLDRGADLWVMRLDGDGGILWQKVLGGTEDDSATSIRETPDGGFVVSGLTWSFGAGLSDLWVIRLDGSGNTVWQRSYGGEGEEGDSRIMPAADGGFVVASSTMSFGAGDWDAWVLKLSADGTISDDCPPGIGEATSASVFETTMAGETITLVQAGHDAAAETTSAAAHDVEPFVETQCSL
jgi:hypothetical protein